MLHHADVLFNDLSYLAWQYHAETSEQRRVMTCFWLTTQLSPTLKSISMRNQARRQWKGFSLRTISCTAQWIHVNKGIHFHLRIHVHSKSIVCRLYIFTFDLNNSFNLFIHKYYSIFNDVFTCRVYSVSRIGRREMTEKVSSFRDVLYTYRIHAKILSSGFESSNVGIKRSPW